MRVYNLFYFFFLTSLPMVGFTQGQLNLNLIANELRSDMRYSGSWSYIDNAGNEYALLGAFSGTAIYEIPAAGNVQEVGFIPGPGSNWRELTVLGNFGYVTTEGQDAAMPVGLQVIDLSQLPDTAFLIANYTATFQRGHILQRDIYSELPYIYVIGTSTTGGVHIMDVSNPAAPMEVGLYDPDYYIHDAHINGDLMFACAFNNAQVDIVDISDKTNPQLITTLEDPGLNTHSAWLTEDKTHLFLADESDGLPGRIFNVEDLEDIFEVATYSANLESLVHNPYIRGDFAFISHNTEGLRVVDIKDPSLPVEVGYYDTFEGSSGGFSGLWSACPYFPSGRIIGGDRTKGLFVWEFEETRASRIYGSVIDSISGTSIANAEIVFMNSNDQLTSDADGNFKYGAYPQIFNIQVSAQDYITKNITLDLSAGIDAQLVVALVEDIDTPIKSPIKSALHIFPNPAQSNVIVEVPEIYIGKILELVDASGRVLSNKEIVLPISQIPILTAASGIYLINIKDKKGEVLVREKLIID